MSDRDTTNLWEETLFDLKSHNKTWADVEWVGTREFKISKENFETLAKKTDYYAGYGWQEVASDLIVAGTNWCLRRDEYDGSESWEFLCMAEEPSEERHVEHLAIHEGHQGWESLEELNG